MHRPQGDAIGSKFAQADATPFWFTTVPATAPCMPASADLACDLAIIGGGFTGLWSALKARENDPDAVIVVLEGKRCGIEASGRSGGFCAPSISHGVSNALTRHASEAETLIRLGQENLDGYAKDIERYGIQADFARCGKLNVAATPWQIDGLRSTAQNYTRLGIPHALLEGDALAAPGGQGRAEDILLALVYDVNDTVSLKAGYRLLEGGADVGEVYTFAWINYFLVGMTVSF